MKFRHDLDVFKAFSKVNTSLYRNRRVPIKNPKSPFLFQNFSQNSRYIKNTLFTSFCRNKVPNFIRFDFSDQILYFLKIRVYIQTKRIKYLAEHNYFPK